MPALVPVMFAGLAVIAAALNGIAAMPVLAGAGLSAAGLVFLEQGAQAGCCCSVPPPWSGWPSLSFCGRAAAPCADKRAP